MFSKQLQTIFITMIGVSLLVLAYNLYNSYAFKHQPISKEIKQQIYEKRQEVLSNIDNYYPFVLHEKFLISDKIPSNIYGLTTLDEHNTITVYINKKRIKESLQYILDDVIAHEYAHAVMFKLGYTNSKDGHSKQWQDICFKLGGSRCSRLVNHNDVLFEKMKLF